MLESEMCQNQNQRIREAEYTHILNYHLLKINREMFPKERLMKHVHADEF